LIKNTNDQLKFDNQKLDLIELFIIRVKKEKRKSRKAHKAAKQMHFFKQVNVPVQFFMGATCDALLGSH